MSPNSLQDRQLFTRRQATELGSRLVDIIGNVEAGERNIRRFADDLGMDIRKSETLLKELTQTLADLKQKVENVGRDTPAESTPTRAARPTL